MKLFHKDLKYFKFLGFLVIISLVHFIIISFIMQTRLHYNFNYEIYSYISRYLKGVGYLCEHFTGIIYAAVFAMSLLGFSLCLIFRYFPHGCIPGLFLFFIMYILGSQAYSTPLYTILIIAYKIATLYLIAKIRFYDYNESGLTGVFKKTS